MGQYLLYFVVLPCVRGQFAPAFAPVDSLCPARTLFLFGSVGSLPEGGNICSFARHDLPSGGLRFAVVAVGLCDTAPLRHGDPCLVRVQLLVSLGASVRRMARAQRHTLERAQQGLGLTNWIAAVLVASICDGSYLF